MQAFEDARKIFVMVSSFLKFSMNDRLKADRSFRGKKFDEFNKWQSFNFHSHNEPPFPCRFAMTKRYRIEQTLRADRALSAAFPESGLAISLPDKDHRIGEILDTVQDLKRFLEPSQRMAADVVEGYRREIAQVYELKGEPDSMKDAIASTKREIATLHRSEHTGKGMRRVAGELDAVVEATEQATTSILAAAEDIEVQATMLRAAGVDTGNNDCVGAILDRTILLYEACNFQDLTGQRITKIVGVLKFVEERLDRMIEVWGGLDAFKDLVDHEAPGAADEQALLNGPKLDDDPGHVSQNDIDALFN
jgi:chemotaxis protein CheZ